MSTIPEDRPSERLRAVVARYKAHNDIIEQMHPTSRRTIILRAARKSVADGDVGAAMRIVIDMLEEEGR